MNRPTAKTYIDRLTKDQFEVGVCEGEEDSSGEAKKMLEMGEGV
jgi:hypothetical protein